MPSACKRAEDSALLTTIHVMAANTKHQSHGLRDGLRGAEIIYTVDRAGMEATVATADP